MKHRKTPAARKKGYKHPRRRKSSILGHAQRKVRRLKRKIYRFGKQWAGRATAGSKTVLAIGKSRAEVIRKLKRNPAILAAFRQGAVSAAGSEAYRRVRKRKRNPAGAFLPGMEKPNPRPRRKGLNLIKRLPRKKPGLKRFRKRPDRYLAVRSGQWTKIFSTARNRWIGKVHSSKLRQWCQQEGVKCA